MGEVEVAEAQEPVLDELSLLFERYRQFYRQEADADLAKAFLRTRLQQKDSVIYVATADGQLTGFMQLYPLLDSLKLGNLWLLNDLYVEPAWRGRGISKMLLSRAKKLAQDTNATGRAPADQRCPVKTDSFSCWARAYLPFAGLLLETQKTNLIGNSLYPSQGWKLDEEFNYYFWASDTFVRGGSTGLSARPGK